MEVDAVPQLVVSLAGFLRVDVVPRLVVSLAGFLRVLFCLCVIPFIYN